jgi:hypothetical protein
LKILSIAIKLAMFMDSTLHMKRLVLFRLTLCIIIFGIMAPMRAQTLANYTFSASSGTYTDLSSPTFPTMSSSDDGTKSGVSIGFDFFYMGTKYSTVGISTNGNVSFGTVSNTTNNDLSSGGGRPLLAPLWDDLHAVTVGSNISYKLAGDAPNRTFTVQFNDMKWNYQASAAVVDFQVILTETTGTIQFVYNPEATAYNAGSTGGASIGITATGTGSNNFMSLNGSGSSPSASVSTETNNITGKPAAGQTYTFTPPTVAAPTSMTFSSVLSTAMSVNWTASSPTTNVLKYAIYRSTDDVTYTYQTTVDVGTNTYAPTGLTASTTYYWKVYAVSEGAFSSVLSGSQATTATPPTYTMGTSGSQSATVTATAAEPSKFYDNGGSGSNYSNNCDATYTFNCAGGKYVRMKINSNVMQGSNNELFYVYDGATTSDRLIGKYPVTGDQGIAYMVVATSGSLTVKFISSSSTTYAGWNIDVWVDDYPGQLWDGSSSTNVSSGDNWEGDVVPYWGYSSIYIPAAGITNFPEMSNSSSDFEPFDVVIESGATFTDAATNSTTFLFVWGDLINNGTFSRTGTHQQYLTGGTSGLYASLGGTGTYTNASFTYGHSGYSESAYYKLTSSSVVLKSFRLASSTVGGFDMNDYNLSVTTNFLHTSAYTFYQKSGTLSLECTSANLTMDDTKFEEGTGTTYFSSGTINAAASQTIPSIQYHNLKVRTNNGYTATIGGASSFTILNDFTILNPGDAGGVATSARDVICNGNMYFGTTGNALTYNLGHRITRSTGSGTTGFTMGDVSGHVLNITYDHATNWAMGLGTSGAASNLTFYGTVNYNSGSAQIVMGNTYSNLSVITGTGTRTLGANTTINGILTLTAGTLDVGSGLNYSINLKGDFVRAAGATFTARSGTFTFDGAATQRINVTAAAGTTPADSDITFYTAIVNGTDVKFYYNKTNDRYINMTDFTINASKAAYIIGN